MINYDEIAAVELFTFLIKLEIKLFAAANYRAISVRADVKGMRKGNCHFEEN